MASMEVKGLNKRIFDKLWISDKGNRFFFGFKKKKNVFSHTGNVPMVAHPLFTLSLALLVADPVIKTDQKNVSADSLHRDLRPCVSTSSIASLITPLISFI